MTTRQIVLAAVIKSDEQYLVCQRPAHKRHGGLWEFPGGKLEAGETLEDAIRRELREELDVDLIDVGSILLTVEDPGSAFSICFVEASILGDPQAIEHSALAWVTPANLPQYPLAPSDGIFLELLLRSRK